MWVQSVDEPARNLGVGATIDGRFALTRVLGEGAFGTVYLAQDLRTLSHVALKVLRAEKAMDAEVVRRFLNEANILGRFSHPNIARAYAWGVHNSAPYLAMEYLPGVSLDRLLTEHARASRMLSLSDVADLFAQLCDAVAYAHANGVVHRDLKPENVMLLPRTNGAGSTVKLLDLGIAKVVDGQVTKKTTEGRVLGSPLYMAPEQWQGIKVDERADIFALGTILFELLTLRKAWLPEGTQNVVGVFQAVMAGPRPDVVRVRSEVPLAIAKLIQSCTMVDAALRPASVESLRTSVAKALQPSVPRKTSHGRSAITWTVGLLVGALTSLGTIALLASNRRSSAAVQPVAWKGEIHQDLADVPQPQRPQKPHPTNVIKVATTGDQSWAHAYRCMRSYAPECLNILAVRAKTDEQFSFVARESASQQNWLLFDENMKRWKTAIPTSPTRDQLRNEVQSAHAVNP